MKKKWIIGLVCATLSVQTLMAETLERLPGYVQAEKFMVSTGKSVLV